MEQVKSALVRDVAQNLYGWWGRCAPADWAAMVEAAQATINNCAATLPVPVMDLNESRPQFSEIGNPLGMAPECKEVAVASNPARYAGRAAQILRLQGHPVFYLNKTLVVSAQYRGEDQLIKDIFVFAPIVIYHENKDDGRPSSLARNALITRPYGLAVVVMEAAPRGKF